MARYNISYTTSKEFDGTEYFTEEKFEVIQCASHNSDYFYSQLIKKHPDSKVKINYIHLASTAKKEEK